MPYIRVGVGKCTGVYLGDRSVKVYLGDRLLTSVKVDYQYGGQIVHTTEVMYGELVSGYIPPAVSGKTFLGWSRNLAEKTPETIYAEKDMTIYGICNASRKVSNNGVATGDGHTAKTSFTLSGSWPDNAQIQETIDGSGISYPGTGGGHSTYVELRNNTMGGAIGATIGANQNTPQRRTVSAGKHKSVSYTVTAGYEYEDDCWIGSRAVGTAAATWVETEIG